MLDLRDFLLRVSYINELAATYMNNPPKDHHYVPKCYLNSFTNTQNKLWKLRNDNGFVFRKQIRAKFAMNLTQIDLEQNKLCSLTI